MYLVFSNATVKCYKCYYAKLTTEVDDHTKFSYLKI
jgi:hypothetical protein